jgi:uncharacterized DUF497 family protein
MGDVAEQPYDWDEGNQSHIWRRHRLTRNEVEQALDDPDGLVTDSDEIDGEERMDWLGMSDDGTVVFVVFTERGEHVRLITARRATSAERRHYREA